MSLKYWEPHTSSVDFCESNYYVSNYIVEFHNSWSSLVISLFGLLGIFYGNPTKEWRFTISYIILFIIGIGSFLLHSTLHWLPQSSDEVPMLWINNSYLYCLLEMNAPFNQPTYQYLGIIIIIVTIIQTYVYYALQVFYPAFLFSFISVILLIIIWTRHYSMSVKDPQVNKEQSLIYKLSFCSFALVGGVLWLIDMNLCSYLIPIYKNYTPGGMTFHIIWHITAGYAAYMLSMFLGLIRVYQLQLKAKIYWIAGFLPVWTETSKLH